jgi:hypothetical protein
LFPSEFPDCTGVPIKRLGVKTTDVSRAGSAVGTRLGVQNAEPSLVAPQLRIREREGSEEGEEFEATQLVSVRKSVKDEAKKCCKQYRPSKTGPLQRLRDLSVKLGPTHKDVKSLLPDKHADAFETAYDALSKEVEGIDDWTIENVKVEQVKVTQMIKAVQKTDSGVKNCIEALRAANAQQRVQRAIDTRRVKSETGKVTKPWSVNGVCNAHCEWLRATMSVEDGKPDDDTEVAANRIVANSDFTWLQVNFCPASDTDSSMATFRKVVPALSEDRLHAASETLLNFISKTRGQKGDSNDARLSLLRMGPKDAYGDLSSVNFAPDDEYKIIPEETKTFGTAWMLSASRHTLRAGCKVDPPPALPSVIIGVCGKVLVGVIKASHMAAHQLPFETAFATLATWEPEVSLKFLKKHVRWQVVSKSDMVASSVFAYCYVYFY